MKKQNRSDPRIGFAFIELATQKDATKYYELACDLYSWGLSRAAGNPDFYDAIHKEVQRIAPILDEQQLRKWREDLRHGDAGMYDRIRRFWSDKDPTPSTKLNERLVEHWRRIAYARNNFTKASNAVYQTDHRGLIYVKLGKPDRVRTGSFGANRSEFKRFTNVALDSEAGDRVDAGPSSGATSRATRQGLMLDEIDRFNQFPEYEIWFYRSSDSDAPIMFLFGNREGIGSFGLRNGLEEFIPTRAFLRTNITKTNGISPGAVLQSVYYTELMHLHPSFADRYFELDRIWNFRDSGQPITQINRSLHLKRMQYQAVDTFDPLYLRVPNEKSTFLDSLSSVSLMVHPFRYLNDSGTAMLAMIVSSSSAVRGRYLDLASADVLPDYSTTYTLVLQDGQQKEFRRLIDANVPREINYSTYVMPHDAAMAAYVISAEVNHPALAEVELENEKEAAPERKGLLIGTGKTAAAIASPLFTQPDTLELSDLTVGVVGSNDASPIPLPVIPSTKIWPQDLLKTYLEIYHLALDEDRMAHFVMDFEVSKIEGKEKSKEQRVLLCRLSLTRQHRHQGRALR
jgi:GWxTD domain-containing protein